MPMRDCNCGREDCGWLARSSAQYQTSALAVYGVPYYLIKRRSGPCACGLRQLEDPSFAIEQLS